LQEALGKDVWHVDAFSKLKDVHVDFGILFLMFHLEAFLFVLVLPSLLGFWNQLVIFYSTLMGVFKRLLGLGSLQCPKALLVHRQVALTIFIRGIGLISLNVIALVTYLKSWALVTFVIASRFLLDFHLFLLKAIVVNSSGSFLFQAHLRSPGGCCMCPPPFEQLAEEGANCF
jgi:hypothetical protein